MTMPRGKPRDRSAEAEPRDDAYKRPDVQGEVLLSRLDVARKIGLSERTVFDLEKEGVLPPPIRIGVWVRHKLSDIDQWIADGCPRDMSKSRHRKPA